MYPSLHTGGCDTAGAGQHRLIRLAPSRPADVAVAQNDRVPPAPMTATFHSKIGIFTPGEGLGEGIFTQVCGSRCTQVHAAAPEASAPHLAQRATHAVQRSVAVRRGASRHFGTHLIDLGRPVFCCKMDIRTSRSMWHVIHRCLLLDSRFFGMTRGVGTDRKRPRGRVDARCFAPTRPPWMCTLRSSSGDPDTSPAAPASHDSASAAGSEARIEPPSTPAASRLRTPTM